MIRWRRVRHALAAAAVWLAATDPLPAETIVIRSGEHGTFTRIVAEGGAGDWSLGRNGNGYELRLKETARYDVSRAFRLIGRDRISTLEPGQVPGSLLIGLACTCHATAFVTPAGAVVIDVAAGPPAEGSPFESPLPSGPSDAPTEPDSTSDSIGAALPTTGSGTAPDGSGRSFAPDSAMPAELDNGLAPLWQGVGMPPAAAPPRPEGPAETASRVAPPAPGAHPTAISGAEGNVPFADAAATSRAEALLPSDAAMPKPDRLPAVGERRRLIPVRPYLPDPRLQDAQAELLRQLSRAASQGLVEIGTDRRLEPVETPSARTTPPAASSAPPSTDPRSEPLAVHAETSIDRDTLHVAGQPLATAEGVPCLPDETFDVAAWGDDRPLPIQIAERRAHLVGEFDRPDPESALALARLYLHFGFGAESQAVLRAFELRPDGADILADMGRILDGKPVEPGSRLVGMSACDTAAALWAVMASPQVSPATDIGAAAVLRAFSALPPHLRRLLGPGLAERLIAAGHISAAVSVRDAIARAPGYGGSARSLVEARVDLAAGDPTDGERRLDSLARSNDPLAPEALMLTIESRLGRGEAVEAGLADSAEALAFEHRSGAIGPALAALHVLARASSGDFARAFAAWRDWPDSTPSDIRDDTAARLFEMLAEKADDRTFLLEYFRNRHLLTTVKPGLPLRLSIAERLATAGFSSAVRHILAGDAANTDRGRELLAQAALAELDPVAALGEIAGMKTTEAQRLAAEALAMKGDHPAASATFKAIGERDLAGLEAWRGGDRLAAAAFGPEPLRVALGQLDTLPEAAPDGSPDQGHPPGAAPPGTLAAARDLLEHSRATREALAALLSLPPSSTAVSDGPGG
ncbi:MAG: hypothetical protein ACK4NE_01255 [Albidovulum sp.]